MGVSLAEQRFQSCEILFQPSNTTENQSLTQTICNSVQACHVGMRRGVLKNAILVGGGSLLTGLSDRLHAELNETLPSAFKVRFATSSQFEKAFSVWLGGSILSCLGSFQQLWISRKEYEEHGSAIADR